MLRKAVAKKDPKDWELWEGALMECKEDEGCDWTDKSINLTGGGCVGNIVYLNSVQVFPDEWYDEYGLEIGYDYGAAE